MTIYTLERGLVVRFGDAQWEVQRVLDATYVQLENAETGRIRREKIAKLSADIIAGKVEVIRDSDACSEQKDKADRRIVSIASVADRYQFAYARAHDYVQYLRRRGISKGQRARIAEAIGSFATSTQDPSPPSTSTVMHWMRKLDSSAGNPTCLISGNAHRRRRTRLTPGVRRIVDKALESYYFRKNGSTFREVHDRVIKMVELEGQADAASTSIDPVSISTIRRIAYEVTPFERDRLRLGTAEARHKWRFSKPGKYASRPLERVEMDHTLLDLCVIDERWGIPLGRPTITFLVCSYSGYILGFYISFEGETLARVLQSIKIAIQPKDAITVAAGLSGKWHSMGLWETLIVDNTLSVHAERFRLIAHELCLDLEYCPVRMPWFKGAVERSLGELTRQLPAHGRPQKPGRQADPINPNVTACITFSDLCHGVLRWVVEVHPLEINQRKQSRPIDLFLDGLDHCPAPSFVDSYSQLDVLAGPRKSVTVRHDGITHDWLTYTGDELKLIHNEVGTNFRTIMTHNPYELGSVYVQHPRTEEWVTVPAKDQEYAAGLSATQHRLIRAAAKRRLTLSNAPEVLREARLALQDHWAAAITSGKRIKNTPREFALFQQFSSVAITPSATAPRSPVGRELFACDDETVEVSEPIPSFEAFLGDAK